MTKNIEHTKKIKFQLLLRKTNFNDGFTNWLPMQRLSYFVCLWYNGHTPGGIVTKALKEVGGGGWKDSNGHCIALNQNYPNISNYWHS